MTRLTLGVGTGICPGGNEQCQLMAYQAVLAVLSIAIRLPGFTGNCGDAFRIKERLQKEFWRLYTDNYCTFDSPMCEFMLAHLDEIRANAGQEEVDRFLLTRYGGMLENGKRA